MDEQEDGRGLTMELKDSDVDPALLAGYSESKFVVRYSVKILDGSSLGLEMVVRNVGTVSLPPFSLAFHSYFRVAAASVEVRLNSTDVRFLDQLSGSEGVNAGGVVEGFGDREIDLVCYGVTNPIEIVTNDDDDDDDDDEGGASANATTTVVTIDASDGLRDAVVWNPHVAKSKAMADFGDEEYREMVCVESARIETPVVVGAGGEWACSLRFRV